MPCGMAKELPSSKVNRARLVARAAASMAGSGSTPVTRIPACAKGTASVPGPQPRSRTASPGSSPASAITQSIRALG